MPRVKTVIRDLSERGQKTFNEYSGGHEPVAHGF
ncbi:hypothetical protein GALL_501130 [mine drainage metagenome]|uniref:Uncharacterized protein n=1 Tax=mine drainage metagenome TaxID=410659 RepID=A0A1J5PAQ4_9ZZZZ